MMNDRSHKMAAMKIRISSLIMLAVLAGTAGAGCQAQSIQLFNGRNLDGWYTFLQDRGRDNDPQGVFSVKDGVIRISGEEWGCITTRDEYENYRLIVEYQWGEKTFEPRLDRARDSGVLLHSIGEDGGSGGIWMHSIECQIIEGGTGDFIVVGDGTENFRITCPVAEEKQDGSYVFHPGGKEVTVISGRINWYGRDPEWNDELEFRGRNDVENLPGDWNRLECIADGDRLTYILNGEMVNAAKHVSPARGRIQIQSEGAEIFFRRVELVPIHM